LECEAWEKSAVPASKGRSVGAEAEMMAMLTSIWERRRICGSGVSEDSEGGRGRGKREEEGLRR
jgi:hypothetical protein